MVCREEHKSLWTIHCASVFTSLHSWIKNSRYCPKNTIPLVIRLPNVEFAVMLHTDLLKPGEASPLVRYYVPIPQTANTTLLPLQYLSSYMLNVLKLIIRLSKIQDFIFESRQWKNKQQKLLWTLMWTLMSFCCQTLAHRWKLKKSSC